MVKKILLIFSLFFIQNIFSQQNLVLNPSFENVSAQLQCSFYANETFPFTNWKAGSYGTSDAYSMNLPQSCPMYALNPNFSAQIPRTGNNYVGFGSTHTLQYNYREYVRGQLSQPLQVGELYKVEFYVCLSNHSSVATNNIGLKFINNSQQVYQTSFVIPLQPDVNYTGTPITDRDNWTLLSFYFIPTVTNLDAFIIGNFFTTDDTDTEVLNPNDLQQVCHILLEDVSVFQEFIHFEIQDEICAGDDLVLPIVSENGIEGTWSPAFNNQETTTYTFTPDNEDLDPIEITIVVNPRLIPEFDEIEPFCDLVPNNVLPSISNNGIEGTWSPEIDQYNTITYTFTPIEGVCADQVEITIIVYDPPIFNQVEPFCFYDTNFSLPTTSINGISGVWSPFFDPYNTKTYTFTPTDWVCSTQAQMTITVHQIPVFDSIEPFCNYDVNFTLPTVSKNGIEGTWSPEFDPYNSKIYTFTRVIDQCIQEVTLDVLVYNDYNFTLNHYCFNSEYFVEIDFNNSYSPNIINYDWKINNTSVQNNTSKLNLANHSSLLNDINKIEVTITDDNGCSRTNEVSILGKYFCKIQKGISPNGDGLNDYFDLASFGGVDLKIFNRHGKEVYKKSNYKVEWSGQSNKGNLLPTGTYFYQIKTNIGEQFTGWIQLNY